MKLILVILHELFMFTKKTDLLTRIFNRNGSFSIVILKIDFVILYIIFKEIFINQHVVYFKLPKLSHIKKGHFNLIFSSISIKKLLVGFIYELI
jgi:hypothetical protein